MLKNVVCVLFQGDEKIGQSSEPKDAVRMLLEAHKRLEEETSLPVERLPPFRMKVYAVPDGQETSRLDTIVSDLNFLYEFEFDDVMHIARQEGWVQKDQETDSYSWVG